MHFSSIWWLALAAPLLQTPQPIGVKITLQYGAMGHSNFRTTYILPDRLRTEYRHSLGGSRGEPTYGPRLVRIVRCDLGKSFELNLDTSEYTSTPYPPNALTRKGLKTRGLHATRQPPAATPTIRVETETTDTGERKEMFGHTARHVITTTTQTPLAGSRSTAQESVTDGWYIDFDQRLSCDPKPTKGKHGFVLSRLSAGNGTQPVEVPEFVTLGEPETGFALYSKMTPKSIPNLPDFAPASFETQVTEFDEGPLDPALFEIPAGFKEEGDIERDPPASLPARKP